ncbi:kappaPI-actitoxin-Avd3d [Lingula anatina]|uniref:KappaPI-actitoxin-Avd3d n=1 Tax=Lingula anatina TaxID=7574 RepID=A0A1S3HH37_LINAN|nr:kappaPI-actitoxin-Avd3d [Lingula anatina]|eukprot:XP_013385342.1 kappaPI-actitoxin-Avd3d [Lingula anatina]
MDCPKGETYVQDKVICEKEPCPQPDQRIDPICLIQPIALDCGLHLPMYFFHVATRQCELFIYKGCQGNIPFFRTLEDCEAKCLV